MRMNDMNAYLEKHGLQVRRTYIGNSKYEFKIVGFNEYRMYIFNYPVGRPKPYLAQAQEKFLDGVLNDFWVKPITSRSNRYAECTNYIKNDLATTKKMLDTLQDKMWKGSVMTRDGHAAIEKVIFNDPLTIVRWTDGTKTIVKAENEAFDPEKGLAMAIAKKAMGNKGNYFNEIKKWTEPYFKEQAEMETWLENFMENLAGAALYFNSNVKDNKEDKNNG